MISGAAVPDRVIYVLRHLLGERALAAASVIRCGLRAPPVPPIYASPYRDARTSERLGYGFRRYALKRHDHRGERLTRIWLLGMRRKLRNLVDLESVRVRNSHPWHRHSQSFPSAVSHYTS